MKKQSPEEAVVFLFIFVVVGFFSKVLGNNWRQQWGVRYMKKHPAIYCRPELSIPHAFFQLGTRQSSFGCRGDQHPVSGLINPVFQTKHLAIGSE